MTTLNLVDTDLLPPGITFRATLATRRGERTITCYLFRGDEKIFVMQDSACIKSHYSDADRIEHARLNSMTPVRDGDVVEVDGQQYKIKMLGDYSDAGYLIKL